MCPSIRRPIDVIAFLTQHVAGSIEVLATWSNHKCIVHTQQLNALEGRTGCWVTTPSVVRETGPQLRTGEVVSIVASVAAVLVSDLRSSTLNVSIERVSEGGTGVS